MAETDGEESHVTQHEILKVSQNVLVALSILFFATMCIVGFAFLNSCPTQPLLAVYMILQGVSAQSMPVLYIIKYRCSCGTHISRIIFFTSFIVIVIVSIALLIAGTHWMATTECTDTGLYQAGISFMVILWVAAGLAAVVFAIKAGLYYVNRDTVTEIR